MNKYIDHLKNSTNISSDSSNMTGGNIDLQGGFPSIFVCDNMTEHVSEKDRSKERNIGPGEKLVKSNITSILHRRRQVAPFIKIDAPRNIVNRVDDVNSDSIQFDNEKKEDKENDISNIGGFLNLFEKNNIDLENSIDLPNNLSSEKSKKNNIENIDIKEMESESSIALPGNIEVIDIATNNKKTNIVSNISDSIDSIVLPGNIEINNNDQHGGEIDNFSENDSIDLPSEINIIDINQNNSNTIEIQNGGYEEIASETSDYNIDLINNNASQTGGYNNINSETSDNNIGLRANISNKNDKEMNKTDVDTEVFLPTYIEVIDII